MPPERWLRDDIVDGLRQARAQLGLGSSPYHTAAKSPAKRARLSRPDVGHTRTGGDVTRLFLPVSAGAVAGLLLGVAAALVTFAHHVPVLGR